MKEIIKCLVIGYHELEIDTWSPAFTLDGCKGYDARAIITHSYLTMRSVGIIRNNQVRQKPLALKHHYDKPIDGFEFTIFKKDDSGIVDTYHRKLKSSHKEFSKKFAEFLKPEGYDYQIIVGQLDGDPSSIDVVSDMGISIKLKGGSIEAVNASIAEKVEEHYTFLEKFLDKYMVASKLYKLKANGCWDDVVTVGIQDPGYFTSKEHLIEELQDIVNRNFEKGEHLPDLELIIAKASSKSFIEDRLMRRGYPVTDQTIFQFSVQHEEGETDSFINFMNENGELDKVIEEHPEPRFPILIFEVMDEFAFERCWWIEFDKRDIQASKSYLIERILDDCISSKNDFVIIIPHDPLEIRLIHTNLRLGLFETVNGIENMKGSLQKSYPLPLKLIPKPPKL